MDLEFNNTIAMANEIYYALLTSFIIKKKVNRRTKKLYTTFVSILIYVWKPGF